MSFRSSFFRKIYQAHTYAGMFVAVQFLVFSISGLSLLFKDEIQGVTGSRSVLSIPGPQSSGQIDAAVAAVQSRYPHDRLLSLFPDERDPQVLQLRLGVLGSPRLRGARRVVFDLRSMSEADEPAVKNSGFFDWMLRLHRELFLGSAGKWYVGFAGLAYVFMLVSGFFIYGKFVRNRPLGLIRQARSAKLSDLHKFVGVMTFGWGLVVGVSGVFLAFDGILIKFFQATSLKHLALKYPGSLPTGTWATDTGGVARVIDTALGALPGSTLSYLSFPGTEYGISGHYLVLVHGVSGLSQKVSELVVVDAKTSLLAEVVHLPFYLKIALLSQPLHFGNYGGWFLKVVWALFTVGAAGVVLMGVAAFILKRRKKSSTAAPSIVSVKVERPYSIPITLAVSTGFSLLAGLFLKGRLGQGLLGLLLLPWFWIFFRRKPNV